MKEPDLRPTCCKGANLSAKRGRSGNRKMLLERVFGLPLFNKYQQIGAFGILVERMRNTARLGTGPLDMLLGDLPGLLQMLRCDLHVPKNDNHLPSSDAPDAGQRAGAIPSPGLGKPFRPKDRPTAPSGILRHGCTTQYSDQRAALVSRHS